MHPIITLIGEDWFRMEEEHKETLNLSTFSTDLWTERCRQLEITHPHLPRRLTMIDLRTLIKDQQCRRWWLRGTPDEVEDESEEDELAHESEDDEDDDMDDPGT